MYKSFFKRLFDFLAAFFGLLVLSPLFIVVMIGLYVANQGKPFFFQARPGLNERIFKIIKFKTMNDKKDSQGNLLPDGVLEKRTVCLDWQRINLSSRL
jgi:lipopolysaccharide/colanic/teichoic acid biosynthesis glycosyltransferase